jgi:hypothetical protein
MFSLGKARLEIKPPAIAVLTRKSQIELAFELVNPVIV